MRGQRRKAKFWKRRHWGSVRAQLRSRFSKGNYEVEQNHLKPYHQYSWDNYDFSRIRWKLKHRNPRVGPHNDWWLGVLRGDTIELEKKYGVFFPRCPLCGEKLIRFGLFFLTPQDFICFRCKKNKKKYK